MLMEVRHDLPEVGFVKVPCDDRGSVRVFVDVAAELIVEFGQSQARVCLWWNVTAVAMIDGTPGADRMGGR